MLLQHVARLASLVFASSLSFSVVANASELLPAVHSGDVEAVRNLLEDGANTDPKGVATPLYFASQSGNTDIVALLIEHGANVDALSAWGTPLHISARRNHVGIVTLLLENGADPNAIGGDYRRTPLHEAADRGALEAGRLLVRFGANVNARSRWFEPPIHFAAKKEHEEFAQFLLDSGAVPLSVQPISNDLASASWEEGRVRAIECSNCHLLERGQSWGSEIPQVRGPNLWGVVGRPIADLEGFPYSPALSRQTGHWTYERLNQFLADPTGTVPGTDMFAGHEQDRERRTALIAYLRTLSDQPVPLP